LVKTIFTGGIALVTLGAGSIFGYSDSLWIRSGSSPNFNVYGRYTGGNIGIGTSSPTRKFTVVGGETVDSLTINKLPALSTAASLFLTSNSGVISSRTAIQVVSDLGAIKNPMSLLGDLMYGSSAAGMAVCLPGNTSTTRKVLAETGFGSTAAAPVWSVLTNSDVGLGNVENTRLSSWAGTGNIVTIGQITSGSIPWTHVTGVPNTDWNATSGTGQVINKPPIYTTDGLNILDTTGNLTMIKGNILLTNGSIGIGTQYPQSRLSVNGTITTKEVVVTTTGWSDFVFKRGYDLKPLNDVENYIKTNKHLEGIPTEKDVKAKGVAIGDMQAKLLQKIEELTLYTVELNKKVTQLALENKELSKKINNK
jgi:hypothetical protein